MRHCNMLMLLAVVFSGCSSYPVQHEPVINAPVCFGTPNLPEDLVNKFEAIADEQFLLETLGGMNQGKLCQGRVYKSKADAEIMLYRAWNSTNPHSKFGNWWALQMPAGKIAAYRADYEICYQWSPLDKLVRCVLKPDVKVVIGTGQSAECSEYLTYPASDKQQVYIDNAARAVFNCTEFDGEFSWK